MKYDKERGHTGHQVLTCQRCKWRLEMLDGVTTAVEPEQHYGDR